jgi:hypothetical protein
MFLPLNIFWYFYAKPHDKPRREHEDNIKRNFEDKGRNMQHIENKVVFAVNYRSFDGAVNLFTKHSTMSLINNCLLVSCDCGLSEPILGNPDALRQRRGGV